MATAMKEVFPRPCAANSRVEPMSDSRGPIVRRAGAFDVWRERAVYLLLFLLPVAGISVRHWISVTFAVLILLSLPDLFRARERLTRPERYLFVIVAIFTAVAIIPVLRDGWGSVEIRFLGRDLRFLFLIPIYLMVRRCPDASLWLLRGGLIGGFVVLGQALYDTRVLGLYRAQGFYSPNLLGPYAAIMLASLLVWLRIEPERKWLRYVALASIVAALWAISLSVSRGAYVGLLAMLIVWAGMSFRPRYFALAVLGIAGLALIGYYGSSHVRSGVDSAVVELRPIVQNGGVSKTDDHLGSVTARVEMWRAALLVFRDNPIWGVGRGNYADEVRKHIAAGAVHPDIMDYDHPHNAYLEMLVSKGVAGFLVFLALLFHPLVYFGGTRRQSPATAVLGVVLITGFASFSLTDASTYIKGNFISLFVIYLVIAFSWHSRMLRGTEA